MADADACFTAVVAAGVRTLGPVEDTGVSKVFFILDPDGTHIQLQQFHAGHLRVADIMGRGRDEVA